LEATRTALRRDLNRTSTAVVVILTVVLGLALAGVFAGIRATQNLKRAEAAETQSRDRLWHSFVAQARAVRLTPEAGRRHAALTVLSNAASIRISTALRTEAISALALTDIQNEAGVRPIPRGTVQIEMDMALERFAYGDTTGNVYVCSLTDSTTLQTLRAQELGPGTCLTVRSVAFSPDGTKLAARFDGGAMVIWNLADEKILVQSGVAVTNMVVAGMSFWPDTDKISYGDAEANGQISIHDFATGRKLDTAIRVGARTFRFRPGKMEVAIATDNHVDISDYPVENKRLTLETATRVVTHTWSPAGDLLAVALEDGEVCLWEPANGTRRTLRGHSEPCVRLTFSPDGKLLATGSRDGTTRLWDISLGQPVVVSSEGIAHVFSADGTRLGFWRPAVGFGTWKLTRSECFNQLVCPKEEGSFLSVDLSPNGRWCLATQSKGIRIWDLANDDAEKYFPVSDVANVRISPDETALYVCRRSGLEKWSFTTNASGVTVDNASPQKIPVPDDRGTRAIAVSLDGRRALVELLDSRLVVLDLAGLALPVFLKETCRIVSARTPGSPTGAGRFAISPDGRWAATGFGVGREDRPKIWDAQTGDLVTTLPVESSVVVFSADGKWLGSASVAAFAIWSVGDWKQLNKFPRDEPAVTHGSLAFTRGGSELAVTRSRQQAQLRDAFNDEKFADFVPPQLQSVNSIRMSLDGSVLVTASATDKLQVWRTKVIRQQLGQLGLIERIRPPGKPMLAAGGPSLTQWVLLGSTAGFGLVAVFALLTLRRHRSAISGFLAAEARAAEQNRELEVAKVELMHSQKMQALGTLATGIAHDFNNLLSVIRMSNKLVGREAKNSADIQEHVADIEQAVLQGKSVVGSMLGYARTDEGEGEPTDVSAIVEEAVSLLSREFLSGIALTLELDRAAPRVDIGRGRLEQVLLNLVVNASEAMQGHGKLKIMVHTRATMPAKPYVLRPSSVQRFVELSVLDSGPGIAPDIRARLFEPFFTTKRSGAKAGTGLGLSLIYSIAQQESLGLSVESEPGKGACFSLVIPVR
jgi:signal transduction histidine kinase